MGVTGVDISPLLWNKLNKYWEVYFPIVKGCILGIFVLLFFSAGDWLQGPHVYALYDSYGMTTHQIEILFVAGFGSSMIVGTVVGSFADK